jgi:hypothetical protein
MVYIKHTCLQLKTVIGNVVEDEVLGMAANPTNLRR